MLDNPQPEPQTEEESTKEIATIRLKTSNHSQKFAQQRSNTPAVNCAPLCEPSRTHQQKQNQRKSAGGGNQSVPQMSTRECPLACVSKNSGMSQNKNRLIKCLPQNVISQAKQGLNWSNYLKLVWSVVNAGEVLRKCWKSGTKMLKWAREGMLPATHPQYKRMPMPTEFFESLEWTTTMMISGWRVDGWSGTSWMNVGKAWWTNDVASSGAFI